MSRIRFQTPFSLLCLLSITLPFGGCQEAPEEDDPPTGNPDLVQPSEW
jgi:hypothetical protein